MIKANVFSILFLLALFLPASAKIIDVPADYSGIQMAIDSSSNGDTVLVQPDTYYENINFQGHNIVLGSLFLTTGDTSYISATVIDGDSSGSVVTIASGEDSTAIITGFTVKHGYNSNNGGGFLLQASPKVLHNRISQNRAYYWGGGIYCYGGAPIIEFNEIINNHGGDTFNKGGGGIFCYYSNARISHNIIGENDGSIGGGVTSNNCNLTLAYNVIRNNAAIIEGGGVICYSDGQPYYPTLSHNVITGNTAMEGAGISISEIDPIIDGNTVYHNVASLMGGGLACTYWAAPSVSNNIFWADTAAAESNEIDTGSDYPGYPVVTYCDIQDSIWPGEGNISCDPEFCGPDNGNFYLAGVSCCVGNGQNGDNIGALGVACGPYPPPIVASVIPPQNALNVQRESNISATFDVDMDETTINDSTFIVYAKSTGLLSGLITYDSLTKTVQLEPDISFQEGEVITVTLTTGMRSLAGSALEYGFVWSFTIGVFNSSGIFGSHVDYYAGDGANSVFAADLDNNGDPDLATVNLISSNISVLINDGTGFFTFDSAYAVDGYNPQSLYSADLDRDGDMDLMVGGYINFDSNSVSVYMNNGGGTFSPFISYPTGNQPVVECAADVDGDGYSDIITANFYFDPQPPMVDTSSVSVLLNDGDGTFGLPSEYAIGREPSSIFAADLDNDGDQDIAVSCFSGANISILANNGDGSFNSYATYAVGDGAASVFGADLDGDCDIDLAAVSVNFSDLLSILWNNGDGTFTSGPTYPVAAEPRSVCAADLDGDGDQDIATANRSADNVSVFINNGDGTFADQQLYPVGDGPISISTGDYDGDRVLDIVTSNYFTDDVSVLLNIAPPGWLAGTVIDQSLNPIEGVIVENIGTAAEDTTDINGEYSFGSTGIGIYDISFSHPLYFDTVVAGVEVSSGDTTVVDVIMEELPGLLSGTVTGEGSQPIESVYVEINTAVISLSGAKPADALVLDVLDSVYTDSSGYYECTLIAGSYDVAFTHPDYDDTTSSGVAITPGDTTILDMQLTLSGCDYVTGDVNGSDSYNGLDITFGVAFFKGGSDPMCPFGSCPISPCDEFFYCGDVNGSCSYNGLDITYGVAYLKGGASPIPCGDCPPLAGITASSTASRMK